jgi:hypothetical protein
LLAIATDGNIRKGPRLRQPLQEVIGVHAGKIELLVGEGEACSVLAVDASTLKADPPVALPGCLWHASHTPDGRLLGIAIATTGGQDIPGDSEVVLWTRGSETFQVLTMGNLREEFPFATSDGRVVFNRRLERPPREYDTGVYRRVVCTKALP